MNNIIPSNMVDLIKGKQSAPLEKKMQMIDRIIEAYTVLRSNPERVESMGYIFDVRTFIKGDDADNVEIECAFSGSEPEILHAFYMEQIAKEIGRQALNNPEALIEAIMITMQAGKQLNDLGLDMHGKPLQPTTEQ